MTAVYIFILAIVNVTSLDNFKDTPRQLSALSVVTKKLTLLKGIWPSRALFVAIKPDISNQDRMVFVP